MNNIQQNKSAFNPQMQISCAIDMDCFEIIKTEAIKKYEENIFLLGKIFDNERESSAMEFQQEDNDEDMYSLFDDKRNNDDNDDMDQNERGERMIRDYILRLKTPNCVNEDLIKQLNNAYKEFKADDLLLENNKKSFQESIKKFEDIILKLKNIKTLESDEYFDELIGQADQLGIVPETFKQLKQYEKDSSKVNKDPPFDSDTNLIITPL